MRKLALVFAAWVMANAGEAGATARIDCVSTDKVAWMSFLTSFLGGLRPVDLEMTAGEKSWSTTGKTEGATPVAVSQAFQSNDQVSVDLADADLANVVAELRVHTAVEGSEDIGAGTLRIVGVGVWPVICTGM